MVHILLFEPEKPANTGNIIRSCQSFNATLSIIGKPSFDMSEEGFKRAKLDYGINQTINRYSTIDEFLSSHDINSIYFVTRYGNNIYSSQDYSSIKSDIYFLFGKESSGLPLNILNKYQDRCIRIPIDFASRSLNLSNCVAIILSEVARQQNFFSLSIKEEIKTPDYIKKKDR